MQAPPGPSDDHLIALALAGDEDAFAVMVRRYQDYVFHLCWRVTGDRADAQDLAQDCFLKLHTHLDRWKPGHKLSNWLYTVALNDCRKRLRRRRLAAFFSLDARDEQDRPLLPEPKAAGQDPSQAAEQAQARAVLGACVAALPPEMREAFTLRVLEELDVAGTARAMACSEGSVKTHLSRAREALRRQLEDWQ